LARDVLAFSANADSGDLTVAINPHKEQEMRCAVIVMLTLVGLVGCEPIVTDDSRVPTTGTPAANDTTNEPVGTNTEPSATAPDNTAVNERDASGATKTPIDQDEDQADVKTTAEIRKRIVAQEGMSINAQNAKIMTSKGKVTLRGPVENQSERDTIDRIAREVAGDANVENLLEIANP
jgi:hyperosmotically inducible protein